MIDINKINEVKCALEKEQETFCDRIVKIIKDAEIKDRVELASVLEDISIGLQRKILQKMSLNFDDLYPVIFSHFENTDKVSTALKNSLVNTGITYLAPLRFLTQKKILNIDKIGKKSFEEIQQHFKDAGVVMEQELPKEVASILLGDIKALEGNRKNVPREVNTIGQFYNFIPRQSARCWTGNRVECEIVGKVFQFVDDRVGINLLA